jgi:hypothetical protein
MHWYSPPKANASLDDYASAQHPTKQDARSQSLLREHTRLQDTLSGRAFRKKCCIFAKHSSNTNITHNYAVVSYSQTVTTTLPNYHP